MSFVAVQCHISVGVRVGLVSFDIGLVSFSVVWCRISVGLVSFSAIQCRISVELLFDYCRTNFV